MMEGHPEQPTGSGGQAPPPTGKGWVSRRIGTLLAAQARLRSWVHWLRRIPPQLPLSQQILLAGVAVGVAAGLSVSVFEWLLHAFAALGSHVHERIPRGVGIVGIALVPAAGGAIAGLLTHFYCPEAKGHGVLEVIAAIRERGGHIPSRVALAKALASAATIGSGGSAGREGPVVQIGAAVGSSVGRRLGISSDVLRTLVAGGAAGGVAASFSVPLAGVFFTMEVVLRNLANQAFSAIVISAVTATVTVRLLLGESSFFTPLEYEWQTATELVSYGALGLLCAPVGVFYRWALRRSEELFQKERRWPEWLRPALGGFLVGAMAIALPEIRGTGQATINQVLLGEGIRWTLIILAVGKIVATSLTLGSGGSGGSLMPSLYVGAMVGGVYALLLNWVFASSLPPGAFAIVGMACVFSSSFRAPVTAIIMSFEVTQNYGILMPVMLACVITHLFSRGTS